MWDAEGLTLIRCASSRRLVCCPRPRSDEPVRAGLGLLIVVAAVIVNAGAHILDGWRMRFARCQIEPFVLWRTVGGLRCSFEGLHSYDTGWGHTALAAFSIVVQVLSGDAAPWRCRAGT